MGDRFCKWPRSWLLACMKQLFCNARDVFSLLISPTNELILAPRVESLPEFIRVHASFSPVFWRRPANHQFVPTPLSGIPLLHRFLKGFRNCLDSTWLRLGSACICLTWFCLVLHWFCLVLHWFCLGSAPIYLNSGLILHGWASVLPWLCMVLPRFCLALIVPASVVVLLWFCLGSARFCLAFALLFSRGSAWFCHRCFGSALLLPALAWLCRDAALVLHPFNLYVQRSTLLNPKLDSTKF